jgi:hypothetical protein
MIETWAFELTIVAANNLSIARACSVIPHCDARFAQSNDMAFVVSFRKWVISLMWENGESSQDS